MGSGASIVKEIRQEWLDVFRAMKLRNSEVKKLFNIYNTVDVDRSGSIDVVELLMFLDVERTSFSERIFEAFDKDHTKRIDFYEFVVSVWKFCVLGNEAACVFAFDLYDTNADGRLSTLETTQMFREILGSKALEQDQMQRVLHKLVSGAVNGYVLEDSWREFSKLHQALLVNVFGVQNKLRITTLGVRCWERISRRKIQIRPGCTVRLSDLMVLHSHRKMFTNIKNSDNANQRVSSMMRIVLDNTDNAIAKKTPPPSPKKEQKNTRILSPFFQSFGGSGSSATIAAHRPIPGFVASPPHSRATSPDGGATRKKGQGHINTCAAGSVGSGSSVCSVGSNGSNEGGVGGGGHYHSHSNNHTPENSVHRKPHSHNSQSAGIAAESNKSPSKINAPHQKHTHHHHHQHGSSAITGLHKHNRPDPADLVRIVSSPGEKDVLLG